MRTYERNGIHLEQCTGCRGVFLDFGELEHLTQLESRFSQLPHAQPGYVPVQTGYGPSWGNRDGHRDCRGGLSGLFFSS
jgi:Zn-finger nucleic acid-binding protein